MDPRRPSIRPNMMHPTHILEIGVVIVSVAATAGLFVGVVVVVVHFVVKFW